MTDDESTRQDPDTPHYRSASGGWGSARGMLSVLADQKPMPGAVRTLMRPNKPGGHMCTSCAWTKPETPHLFEFCENGAKATVWDLTTDCATPEFFEAHAVAGLRGWSDHDLEKAGRLTHPALRPRLGPLRGDDLGGGLRGHRRRSARARPQVHRLLHLGPREPGGLLPVPAPRADVRAQQPARQLQHVPQDHQRRAREGHRLVGGHLRAVRLRPLRPPAVLRAEHRHQLPTLPPHPPGGQGARLPDRDLRFEEHREATSPQAVSMEASLSMVHGSVGKRRPASPHLLSEPATVAGIAKATLPPNPRVPWDEWVGDYALVRDLIERTWPEMFRDFNARLFTPGGFRKGNAARERRWETESGRTEFTAPEGLTALGHPPGEGDLTLVTLRSNDQFNTTVYGFSDRLRGLKGARDILLINPEEMARRGLAEGQPVTVECAIDDGTPRAVHGLRVTPHDLPDACVVAYYPEANPLIPLDQHDGLSKTPAFKSTPIRIRPEAGA